MIRFLPIAFATVIVTFVVAANRQTPSDTPQAPPAPPKAPVRIVTDTYFGVTVSDPYRYMEDLKNPQVEAWFKAQNDYTRAVLARIPGRAALLERIKTLDEGAPARITERLDSRFCIQA